MTALPIYSTVKVVKLRPDVDHAIITSSFELAPIPAVGDVGVIVDPTPDGTRYLVEKVRSDGYTDWLVEFAADELEVVP